MAIVLEEFQLQNLLIAAAELGAQKALTATGAVKPFLSLAEAYRQYGRDLVKAWIGDKRIKPIQDGRGTKMRLDRMQLEALAKAGDRKTLLL